MLFGRTSMRRSLLPCLLIYVVASNALAQSISIRPLFGLNVGFATATETPITAVAKGAARLGVIPGLGIGIPLGDSFTLQPEIRYIPRGADIQLIGFLPGTVTFNMIDFPILVRYASQGRTRFVGMAGPHFGLLLSRELNIAGIFAADLSTRFSAIDFGLTAGVGVEHDIDPMFSIFFDLRFQLGLKDLNDSATEEYKSRDLQFLLGAAVTF